LSVRTLAGVFLVSFLSCSAAPLRAGSAGVRNGGIQGVVYDQFNRPLGGVSVVAVRSIAPPIIRSTVTDEMGNWFLGDLPLGGYTIGFAKFGFRTIDTQQGDPNNQTALGAQVRVNIESGRVSVAPSVNMTALPDTSNGTVNITVLDLASGTPISDATVSLGVGAATSGTPEGRYTLTVPASVDQQGQPAAQPLSIQAEGFEPFTSTVTVLAKQTQNLVFRISPLLVGVNGLAGIQPGGPPADLTQTSLTAIDLNPALTQGAVSASGDFSIRLPASTSTITRKFTLQFLLSGFQPATVPVTAPRAGAFTVPGRVVLVAQSVELVGTVVLSSSQPPQGGARDLVTVIELGKQAAISGGSYRIAVPIGRPLTLQVDAFNATTGRFEQARTTVTATSDGSPNPVYTVPLIMTR
jgi:hypothetical protein